MIEIKNISKNYGDTSVLKNFSHRVGSHGITCLLGVSGVGKSTLFNLLAGFDREYTGEILVEGQDIATLSKEALANYRKDCIGFVFQEYHLLPGHTVLDNILLAAELSDKNEAQIKVWALELLERLGIRDKADEKTENLSGGQKQRVAIARALAGDPAVILADEPTGALDRKTATEIMELFAEIARERPVLIITHDKKICDFADEVITIENGACKVLKESPCSSSDMEEPRKHVRRLAVEPTSMSKRAVQNFRVHFKRFLGISVAIAAAVCAVLMSFSSQNMIDKKIHDFEEKNTVFAWGQVMLEEGKSAGSLCSKLEKYPQVQDYYIQYQLPESKIVFAETEVKLSAKSFGSISAEFMNMGVMPRDGEISITPSLARQLTSDIQKLIGKELTFVCGDFKKQLRISGIFNGSFDDYYLDADTEQEIYDTLQEKGNPVSVSYKVNGFQDVLDVENMLLKDGFTPTTASKQVDSFQTAFEKLQTLFFVVSVFVGIIALFICIMLLIKTARMRIREMGLMMALGYRRNQIHRMLFGEGAMLSALSALTTVLMLFLLIALFGMIRTPIIITVGQFALGIMGTLLLVWPATAITNEKLLKTEPAAALKQ